MVAFLVYYLLFPAGFLMVFAATLPLPCKWQHIQCRHHNWTIHLLTLLASFPIALLWHSVTSCDSSHVRFYDSLHFCRITYRFGASAYPASKSSVLQLRGGIGRTLIGCQPQAASGSVHPRPDPFRILATSRSYDLRFFWLLTITRSPAWGGIISSPGLRGLAG